MSSLTFSPSSCSFINLISCRIHTCNYSIGQNDINNEKYNEVEKLSQLTHAIGYDPFPEELIPLTRVARYQQRNPSNYIWKTTQMTWNVLFLIPGPWCDHGAHAFLMNRHNPLHNPPFPFPIPVQCMSYSSFIVDTMHLHFVFVCRNVLDLIPVVCDETQSLWLRSIFELGQYDLKITILATLSLNFLSAAPHRLDVYHRHGTV